MHNALCIMHYAMYNMHFAICILRYAMSMCNVLHVVTCTPSNLFTREYATMKVINDAIVNAPPDPFHVKACLGRWVNLGGMSGCFGAVVGAPRVGVGEITLPSGGLVGRIQKFCTA